MSIPQRTSVFQCVSGYGSIAYSSSVRKPLACRDKDRLKAKGRLEGLFCVCVCLFCLALFDFLVCCCWDLVVRGRETPSDFAIPAHVAEIRVNEFRAWLAARN